MHKTIDRLINAESDSEIVYQKRLKIGIERTSEFEKKLLATHAVNVGLKCGHGCYYCYTPSLLRTHYFFKEIGKSPYERGYSIVDPNVVSRVAKDVKKIHKDDMVMVCTYTDAWAPEPRKFNLGRRILETLLKQGEFQVRILTKNTSIKKDFDFLKKYSEKVMLGFSITALPNKKAIRILEPNAPRNKDRISTLIEARNKYNLRTYAMLCPCLPKITSSYSSLKDLMLSILPAQPEDIWLEPINSRGPILCNISDTLQKHGYYKIARALDNIRHRDEWSRYALTLTQNSLNAASKLNLLDKLHILLYKTNLQERHIETLKKSDTNRNIVWL